MGVWDDTIIMTYSEFGRRAKENGSGGTDHGMAAPHFIFEGKLMVELMEKSKSFQT